MIHSTTQLAVSQDCSQHTNKHIFQSNHFGTNGYQRFEQLQQSLVHGVKILLCMELYSVGVVLSTPQQHCRQRRLHNMPQGPHQHQHSEICPRLSSNCSGNSYLPDPYTAFTTTHCQQHCIGLLFFGTDRIDFPVS